MLQDENGNSNGCEWLPVEQVGNLMCQELGYEDTAELEDALHGPFEHFLDCLPHVTKKKENDRCGRTRTAAQQQLPGPAAGSAARATQPWHSPHLLHTQPACHPCAYAPLAAAASAQELLPAQGGPAARRVGADQDGRAHHAAVRPVARVPQVAARAHRDPRARV